ncbi:MAG TPA: DUF3145 family protein [Candidatus Nanopelagicaceae bacterium]
MDRSAPPTRGPIALSRGYLVIHSAPTALCRHVEWALQNLLGKSVQIQWRPQPLLPGTHRAVCEWRNRVGLGAELASALRAWHYLRFEIREEGTSESTLFRFTPNLGIHRAVIDGAGSVMVNENQITSVMNLDEDSLREALTRALGSAWDLELEQFRQSEMTSISQSQAI